MDQITRHPSSEPDERADELLELHGAHEPHPERPARDATVPVAEGQQPLPFDDEADVPIAFSLTARARRHVAPEELPALRVLDGLGNARTSVPRTTEPDEGDGDLDLPGDTRPSRARALRRAGVGVAAIAGQLAVDELVVRAWIGDVAVHPTATRRARTATDASVRSSSADRLREELLQRTRSEACEDGRVRLRRDPVFAAGLGLLAALASTDEHAVTLTTSSLRLAARVTAWLVEQAGTSPTDIRVILRLGPDVAGDLARRRWAEALQLPSERIVHTRWRVPPAPDAQEALLRLPDPALAATVAGWRDALLEPVTSQPADTGF